MAEARRLLSALERTTALLAATVGMRLQRDTGLPLVLFESMAVIADRDQCRIYDLAADLGVSSGGASKLVDRLEAEGYCRRRPNPRDRRSSLLELTPAGTALMAAAERVVEARLDDLLASRLSRADIAELAALLQKLLSALLAG
jgi:MarR family transcriptional regulator, organic hydroperoxide resistance regulator